MNIKRAIDKSVHVVIEKLGYLINPLILNFTNENNHLLIFFFHGLYESTAQKELNHIDPQNNITVSQFTEFIDYFLHHNYQFIKPEDLLGDLREDHCYVMITFDDGYFNNSLAVELLSKYEIPATFFITTNNVFENKSYWWDIIYKYRTIEHQKLEKIRKEQGYLKNFKYTFIEKYIEQNFGKKSFNPWSDIDRPFTISELKHFSQNTYISIGNHTHNHSIVTNYSEDEIIEEFEKSNKLLFDLTGSKPICMAFPNGNFNSSVLEIARENGFKFVFTTQSHINYLPVAKGESISLGRFMAKTTNIKNWGSFSRLGYTTDTLYLYLRKQIIKSKS